MEEHYFEERFEYIEEETTPVASEPPAVEPAPPRESPTLTSRIASLLGFERAVATILGIMVLLLPFFFLPGEIFQFQTTKGLLISLGVLLSLAVWIIGSLKAGRIETPKTFLFIPLGLLVAVYGVSSFLSDSFSVSFSGQGFEIGTTLSIFLFAVLMFLIPAVFKTRKWVGRLYGFLFASLLIVTLIQLLRLFIGPEFLSFGVLTSSILNVVGTWNDLGVFYGLIALLALSGLEFLPVGKKIKSLLVVLVIVSLFFISLVNFLPIWIVIGLFALFFFAYTFALERGSASREEVLAEGRSKKFAVSSLVVFVIALVFVITGGSIGTGIANSFSINRIEARPSFDSTFQIAGDALKTHPIFGLGPNQFERQWVMSKPLEINQTVFWNVDFSNGVGVFPSEITSVGILGILAWLFFIGAFILLGIRSLFRLEQTDIFSRYLGLSSFFGAVYLWIVSFLYIPNIVMFAFAFILSGVFIAVEYQAGAISSRTFVFSRKSKAGFASIFVLVVALILSASGVYFVLERYTSQVVFARALQGANSDGDLVLAEERIIRALNLRESDQYYRTLAEVYLVQLNQISSSAAAAGDTQQAEFQETLGKAIDSARRATETDEHNYQNWLSLGQVYEAIVPLGIEGAYTNARETYARAQELNPTNPAIDLVFARLAIAGGDMAQAREDLVRAIEKKSNYTEAVFLLSQIEVQEGNLPAAIEAVTNAARLSPNDPTIFFQLGLLYYNQRDYVSSANALEQAIRLQADYSNAKYFLGLSYENQGRSAEALEQFEDILVLNPENQEVQLIINNLRAGRSPFAGAEPPIDDTPEERDTLPIDEDIQSEEGTPETETVQE